MKLFVMRNNWFYQDDIEAFKKEDKGPIKIKSSEESTKKAIKIKSPEESIEIKSPEKDENTTNWYDKNKLKKITAVVISNKFNHKTKIKNSSILTSGTWSITLTKIQLAKHMLK